MGSTAESLPRQYVGAEYQRADGESLAAKNHDTFIPPQDFYSLGSWGIGSQALVSHLLGQHVELSQASREARAERLSGSRTWRHPPSR